AYPSLTVPFQTLYPHPAQMRTRYSVASLAELVCQIAARGLDPSQPIVVQPFDDEHDNYVAGDHPTATRPDLRYYIVSGHRRFYAACFARVIEAGGHEVTLEEAQRYFAGRISDREYVTEDDLFGEIEGLAAARYTIDIPVQVFDGNYEQGVLLLQASNFGAEEPDTLGIAHSLLAGQQIGISLSRAAQNIGQTEGYVRDLIAVAALEDEAPALVRAIVDGKVSRSIARTIDTLGGEKRTAAIRFAEANLQSGIIVKDFEATIRKLRDFDGFRVPMVVENASQRNVARALANMWREEYEADPVNAWHVAIAMFHLGKSAEPYRMSRDIHDWMQAFGITFTGHWGAALTGYLTEVACATCPLNQLPDAILGNDLTQPRYPCRAGQRGQVERCLHGLAPTDPPEIRVPLSWGERDGIVVENGQAVAPTTAALLAAYEEQQALEEAQREKERKAEEQRKQRKAKADKSEKSDKSDKGKKAAKPDKSPDPSATPAPDPSGSPSPAPAAVAEPDGEPAEPTTSRIMAWDVTAEQVRQYQAKHTLHDTRHPLATPCATCEHWLEQSNKDVPNCAWVHGTEKVSRPVRFHKLVGDGVTIPVCEQYKPNAPWRELIAPHHNPPGLPREWYYAQIIAVVKEATFSTLQYGPGQFLSGRPLSGGLSVYKHWFAEQFESQRGDLTEAQLFTLLLAVQQSAARSQQTFLLLSADAIQVVEATKVHWLGAGTIRQQLEQAQQAQEQA
ncbi:MAG: ParB N-terminal domain-containing protein, partial [Anaerolineae bacterium]|nr:ParB N-terminal domain-containing protein [Anaerolineae bacterium]